MKLSDGSLEGLVIKQQSGFFSVETSAGIFVCQLRGRLKEETARRVRKEEEERTDLCAIGDRVTIALQEDGTGVIEAVQSRQQYLSRADHTGGRSAQTQGREQVIIANADQAVFVFAAAQPQPNPRTLDRLLVAAEKGGIPTIRIVCNKVDLSSMAAAKDIFGPYEKIGYSVVYVSSVTEQGIDELRDILTGKISVFTGPSGVGKTSLLNAIQSGLGLRVNSVSTATTKGRHTTVHSELFPLAGGGYVADTPGIRSIGIWDVEPGELEAYYVDIEPFMSDCRFTDCTHMHEPGCAIVAAVKRGDITPDRFKSFHRLRKEIEDTYEDWV